MNQKFRINRPYGLKARLTISLLVAAVISAAAFIVLYIAKEKVMDAYFANQAVQTKLMEKSASELREYVDKNNLSSEDMGKIAKWEEKEPLILLEIYDGNDLVYNSYYDIDELIAENYLGEDARLTDRDNVFNIEFTDKDLTAALYVDIPYRYYVISDVITFIIAVFLFLRLFILSIQEMTKYIIRLGDEVHILEGGNLDYEITVAGNDELTDLAKSLNRMRKAFENQIVIEHELRQTRSKLVSEMSHDLRTPLTGLMLYTEILRAGEYKDEAELKEYLDKIENKACMIKQLSDNILEYVIGNRKFNDTGTLRYDSNMPGFVRDIVDELEAAGFKVNTDTKWRAVKVRATEDIIKRISENIVTNIIKYADKSADVYIETVYEMDQCGLSFINAVDKNSKGSEGYGVGLESVESMMNDIGGSLTAEQTENAFEVTLMFLRDWPES